MPTTTPHLFPVIALIGESGGGKTSIIHAAIKELPDRLEVIKSLTTRPMRGADDLLNYDLVTHEEFERREKAGRLLQSVEAFGNRYGTDREYVNDILSKKIGIFVMVEEGIRQYQEAGYNVRVVRVIPKGHTPRGGREDEDKKRKSAFGLNADLTIVNEFVPEGFEKAVHGLVSYVQSISPSKKNRMSFTSS